MAKQFVILCSAQRLRFQDDSDASGAYYAFGLNLTAAVGVENSSDTITPAEAAALRPWSWTSIDKVVASLATTPAPRVFECEIIKLPAVVPDLDFARLTSELDNEYPQTAADLSVAAWQLPDLGSNKQIDRKAILNFNPGSAAQLKPWHASIMQLSTYPFPIPQKLNLSFIVKVPKSKIANDKNAELFLAPIINADTLGHFTTDTRPSGTGTVTKVDNRGIYNWQYDQLAGSGLSVFAYVKPVVVEDAAPAPTTYIDLATGWVKSPGNDLFEEDWRARLEQKMGEAFDISELLLDYLRDNIPALTPQTMPFFQRLVISSLRDITGTGLVPSLSGNTLPDDLLGPDPKDKLSSARLDEIRGVEKSLFGSAIIDPNGNAEPFDHKWRLFLRETIPPLAPLTVLDPIRWEENRQPQDCLADLEHLHKTLLDQENLRNVVQAQWKNIFIELDKTVYALLTGWDSDSKAKYEKLKERLSELPPNFSYRSRLASCSLGPVWNALRRIAAVDINAPLDIRGLFPSLLASHIQGRLGLTPEATAVLKDDYKHHLPPCDGTQNSGLINAIASAAKAKAPAVIEGIVPANGAANATDVPHGVSLQAHLTGMIPEGDKSFDSLLNQISGVLVFMRDRARKVWYCLNYANAKVRGDSSGRINALAVPTRINYQNGLTQSLITYNNAPLVAPSPLAKIPLQNQNTVITTPPKPEHKEPLIQYNYFKNPADPEDSRSKIKALVFQDPTIPAGQYEAVVCTVSASGALPKELTVRNNPWEISPAKLVAFNPGPSARLLRPFSYVRKVRVGQIRSKSQLTEGQTFETGAQLENPLNLPRIPDKVYPRALRLPPFQESGRQRSLANDIPLLLLASRDDDEWIDPARPSRRWQASFEFSLRKPATDMETWHRWVNRGATNKILRAAVLADYYDRSESNRNLAANVVRTDVSFDDASVDKLFVRVLHFAPDQTWKPIVGSPQAVIPTSNTGAQNMSEVQSNAVRFKCVGRPSGAARLTTTSGVVTIEGVAGEIYWIQVYSTIKKTDQPRFARFFGQEFEQVPGEPFVLASPFELLLEVATKELPSRAELWRSVTPRFKPNQPDNLGDRVEVKLLSNDPPFRHVYRAELQRQSWYWQGRATKELPSTSTPPNDFVDPDFREDGTIGLSAEVRKWEEFEFAARDESDFTVIDFKTGSRKTVDGKEELFTYTEQLTPEASASQVTSDGSTEKGDLRANYYRYSARVFSRYEGIIRNGEEAKSQALNPSLMNDDPIAKWRRTFVPCRRREKPPVPQIKLILPLTENYIDDRKRSPGLLVVLNETWHEFAGLGEGIVAEVETLADPHNASTVPDPCPLKDGAGNPLPTSNKFYYELGPDPILDGRSNPLLQKSDQATPTLSIVSLSGIRGPVGHTHDSSDEGALFSATSFVIPAPQIKTGAANPPEDLAWYLAKIRLRRIVRLKGSGNLDPGAELRSDFTSPQWVQYLPAFSVFSSARQTSDLAVKVNGSTVNIFTQSGGVLIREADLSGAIEKSNPVFKILLLLTRHAYDASGRRNQEVFVGLCASRSDGAWDLIQGDTSAATLATLASDPDVRFRARVVELQAVPADTPGGPVFPTLPATTQELFDLLFAYKKQDDSPIDDLKRPRVVGISEPIEGSRPLSIGNVAGLEQSTVRTVAAQNSLSGRL